MIKAARYFELWDMKKWGGLQCGLIKIAHLTVDKQTNPFLVRFLKKSDVSRKFAFYAY